MTVRWQAPGRVNLIGEHTDYNAGFALPFAIDLSCVAEVGRSAHGFVARSAQQPEPVSMDSNDDLLSVPTWARYVLGPVLALQRLGYDVPPLEVAIDSSVPVGAGLSSSAAVICSVAGAVSELLEIETDLLSLTRKVENEVVGAPTGGLDQLASLRSRANHVLLCDFLDLTTAEIPFHPAADGLSILVVDTGAPHSHASGEYAARRAACEAAASALGLPSLRDADDLSALPEELRSIARHVVTENQRVLRTAELLRAGRLREVGPLITDSHVSMRDDFRVSTPTLDLTVELLCVHGALGARLTGGGFGGCVISLVDDALVPSAISAVEAAYAERGLPRPHSFTVSPSAGAGPL